MSEENQNLRKSKTLTTMKPWCHNENVIWLASTLQLHRNIEKFKFPQKLDAEKKNHVLSLFSKALMNTTDLKNPILLRGDELLPIEKNFLLEHYLVFEGFSEALHGEAFMIDDSGEFLALLNVKDHVRLQFTDTLGDLEKSWNRLVKLENSLQSSFGFAFLPKFGFLTSDPTISGTGLVVEAFLHIPTLIHLNELPEFLEKERNDAVIASGLQGDPKELIGDLLTIKNSFTLGVNEETILSTLRNAILKAVLAEKNARSRVLAERNTTMKDKVSRAVGTLQSSYQLETVEALNALSLVKLGIELGWVKGGMTVADVNHLFFTCRRAHLQFRLKEAIPIEKVSERRASFLRQQAQALMCQF